MHKINFLLIVLAITACSKPGQQPEVASTNAQSASSSLLLTDAQYEASGIELGHLEKKIVAHSIRATGKLDVPPQNMVTVSAPLGGFVKETQFLPGMKVDKGQVIAVLEHPDYIQLQQDYLESKSQLEFLEKEYNRQQELAKENINAQKALQQSKSDYLSMKAKTAGLVAKLKLIHIDAPQVEQNGIQNTIKLYAPITGYITQVHLNIGMYVDPNMVLFKIVDTDHLHAEALVFEKDISFVKKGQTVRLFLANNPVERLASVFLVGKEIDTDRTIKVHCHLEKEDPQLLPGMYFNAIIATDPHEAWVLPETAVVTFEGKDYIFVANDPSKHQFEMVEVGTSSAEEGFRQIQPLRELNPSSGIVVKGSYDLLGYMKNMEEL